LPIQAVIKAVSHDFPVLSSTAAFPCRAYKKCTVIIQPFMKPFRISGFVHKKYFRLGFALLVQSRNMSCFMMRLCIEIPCQKFPSFYINQGKHLHRPFNPIQAVNSPEIMPAGISPANARAVKS